MIKIISFLMLLQSFGDARLTWDANTESDLAGYRVYAGLSSTKYDTSYPVPKEQTSYKVSGLNRGMTHYFALTAFDYGGNESEFSEEVSLYVPQEPKRVHYLSVNSIPVIEDTASVESKLHIIIGIPPMYSDSTAFNPINTDSVQVDIRNFPAYEIVYSETVVIGEPFPKASLGAGKYYMNASAWADDVQGEWAPIDKALWFRLDEFRTLYFEGDIELR